MQFEREPKPIVAEHGTRPPMMWYYWRFWSCCYCTHKINIIAFSMLFGCVVFFSHFFFIFIASASAKTIFYRFFFCCSLLFRVFRHYTYKVFEQIAFLSFFCVFLFFCSSLVSSVCNECSDISTDFNFVAAFAFFVWNRPNELLLCECLQPDKVKIMFLGQFQKKIFDCELEESLYKCQKLSIFSAAQFFATFSKFFTFFHLVRSLMCSQLSAPL